MEARQPSLRLTATAAEKIREIMAVEEIERPLRVHSRQRADGTGSEFDLVFDNAATGDRLVESHGVKLVIDEKSLVRLGEVTIDYVETKNGAGFVFVGPGISPPDDNAAPTLGVLPTPGE